MTVLDDVGGLIENRAPAAICDDCITNALSLSVRQHANRKTNQLAKLAEFDRRRDFCPVCKKNKKVIRYVGRR
ncbi:hypothetical protein [Bradyrhizobium sp. CW1]|uniref:hypothetical protein n=1 Tax=Bradyrhizobium sp. CW1 TaxID=2782686 RepID=UPI0020004CD5|nr:hypothetical protein [Bradyrhizobium sp. CW1]UPJ24253.1 hypothetical protein IVB54_20170 [Bradyrhizobium sp. CW1]